MIRGMSGPRPISGLMSRPILTTFMFNASISPSSPLKLSEIGAGYGNRCVCPYLTMPSRVSLDQENEEGRGKRVLGRVCKKEDVDIVGKGCGWRTYRSRRDGRGKRVDRDRRDAKRSIGVEVWIGM